jgi:two-component system sensor histidine kinase/response regulator
MTGCDVRKFSERIGNDETLLREVADIFLEETPKLLARLQQALVARDTAALERAAHSLKGELAYFGSMAADQAREVERMGRENDLAETPGMVMRLEAEVASLMEAVRRDVRGKGAHAG